MNLSKKLKAMGACVEAVAWAAKHTSEAKAWRECERGDWMLWYAGKCAGKPGSAQRKKLVLAACECARLALPRLEKKYPSDKRPRVAIETAESWARGTGATIEQVRAAYAAYAAAAADAYAAYAAAAADAAAAAAAAYAYAYAAAAAYAAYAAAAAADAAAAAAAADAAADAADAAAYAARTATLKQCAEIVRKHYPKPPRKAVKA